MSTILQLKTKKKNKLKKENGVGKDMVHVKRTRIYNI